MPRLALFLLGLLLLLISTHARADSLKLWTTLPTTEGGCADTLFAPLTDLDHVRATATRFRDGAVLSFPNIPVSGMEGDSLGILFDFEPGTMGEILLWTVDHAGNQSCQSRNYVFAIEARNPPPVTSAVDISYWTGIFGTFVTSTLAETIDFDWAGSPAPGVPSDNWSARLGGNVFVPTQGFWRFYLATKDGGRLWVDGIWLLSDWTFHNDIREQVVSIELSPGEHTIRVDTFSGDGPAVYRLSWDGPSTPKQIIPATSWR